MGSQGGNRVHFLDKNGKLWRFLHLSWMTEKIGAVKQGTVLGKVGNTGLVYPKPSALNLWRGGTHSHMDISRNGKLELYNRSNFIDPEKYLAQNNATAR